MPPGHVILRVLNPDPDRTEKEFVGGARERESLTAVLWLSAGWQRPARSQALLREELEQIVVL